MEAEASGCRILKIIDCWQQVSTWRPFQPWYEAVLRGRELGGLASTLAKVTGNATWGSLSIGAGLRALRYRKPGAARTTFRIVKVRGGNPSARAYDLGEWLCGQTRARLHEGMRAVGDDFICAHTDGLWTQGRGVPGWRQKLGADEMEIMDYQHLRYRRRGGPWRYTMAGVPDREVEDAWATKWERKTDREKVAEL
jgi:hypothetical protein